LKEFYNSNYEKYEDRSMSTTTGTLKQELKEYV
jgi:hypothetical protein